MSLTTADVWKAIDNASFGVLAFVNARSHARCAGLSYMTDGRSLLISTARDTWKVRHIAANPNVSMTVTIPKRVPFLPFIKVPAATITFSGVAEVLDVADISSDAAQRLFRGLDFEADPLVDHAIIRIVPQGDFITYGIGMPVTQMRSPAKARERVPCGIPDQEPATG